MLKKETYSPEFKKINPNAKVPAIKDGDFTLYESHAIMKYLVGSRSCCADHWYPKELKARAKIDEYLDWHHNGVRKGVGYYFFRKYVMPALGSKPVPSEQITESYNNIGVALDTIERKWL